MGPLLRTRLLSALALVLLAACQTTTPIGKILGNPREFDGKTVTIEGEVRDAANLLVIRYYRVEDGSGSITVVAKGAVPQTRTRVRATGVVHQAFALGSDSLTVIVENQGDR